LPVTTVSLGLNSITSNQNGALYQWLDCNNSMAPINLATNQSLNITSNGSYAVHINLSGCVDTSNCITINNVGMDNINGEEIILYPNPAFDFFSIKGLSDIEQIEIFDVSGRLILQLSSTNVYNIESLKGGTYWVKIYSSSSIIIKQLIKS